MTVDNVVTDAMLLIHPATAMYAFPLTPLYKELMGKVSEDCVSFEDDEIVWLQNHLLDLTFYDNLTQNEFAVLSLLFRASIGQGDPAANFCFLYYPEFPETSHSVMKGLGEKAFTEAFNALLRRRLIKRIDLFDGEPAPPESYVYDNRQHYWEYAPTLTYIDFRPFFRDFCSDDPFFNTYPVVKKYFQIIGAMEHRVVQMMTDNKIDWHMDELRKHYKLPAEKVSRHQHLILLDLAK